jgi:toxin ParE1/3/4
LEAAIEAIAADSPQAARKLLTNLLAAADSLETLSERGRIAPELEDQAIRELLIDPYRLIYHVTTERVHILAVVHQARRPDSWRR